MPPPPQIFPSLNVLCCVVLSCLLPYTHACICAGVTWVEACNKDTAKQYLQQLMVGDSVPLVHIPCLRIQLVFDLTRHTQTKAEWIGNARQREERGGGRLVSRLWFASFFAGVCIHHRYIFILLIELVYVRCESGGRISDAPA